MKARDIKKYFRWFVPIDNALREEYIRLKVEHKTRSDRTNYKEQTKYNWMFCNRCWRRFMWDNLWNIINVWSCKFLLCDSCSKDKKKWIRSEPDIEDLIENNIDITKTFSPKKEFKIKTKDNIIKVKLWMN